MPQPGPEPLCNYRQVQGTARADILLRGLHVNKSHGHVLAMFSIISSTPPVFHFQRTPDIRGEASCQEQNSNLRLLL